MKKTLMLAIAGSMMLAACGDKAADDGDGNAAATTPPAKPQPGSWAQKIEVIELTGEGVPADAKDQMNQMFAAVSAQNVCVTPELADQQDISKRMSDLASQGGDCTFERQNVSGTTVDFAGTCKSPGGQQMKVEGKGTNGATAQDMTITINPLNADGSSQGKMVMHVTGERKGECGPDDIMPPAPAAAKS